MTRAAAQTHRAPATIGACVVALLLAIAVVGCASPGTPYAYYDVTFAATPSPTIAQPCTNQSDVVTFSLRNTYNQAIPAVTYRVYQNSDPTVPTSGTQLGTDTTVAIPAFGTVVQSFVIPPSVAGTYTYSVVIDPDNQLPLQNLNSRTATFSLLYADTDIAFGINPTITPANPTSQTPLTLSFSIANIPNPNATNPPTANVTFQIFLDPVAGVSTPALQLSQSQVTPVSGNPNPATFTVSPGAPGGPGNQVQVSVTLPSPGDGNHIYQVVLTPDIVESNTTNDSYQVSVPVAN